MDLNWLCLRSVEKNRGPQEELVGLKSMESTTANINVKAVKDKIWTLI